MPKVAQVAVLQKFPKDKGIFDYYIPSQLPVQLGDLVEVTFRNQSKFGLVLRIYTIKQSQFALKPINKIFISQAINSSQLALIKWLAEYTACGISVIVKMTARSIPIDKYLSKINIVKPKKINTKFKPINLVSLSNSQKDEMIISLITRVVNRGEQVLLLVPEISLIEAWKEKLASLNDIVTYSGDEKLSDVRKAWSTVKNNETKLIIGTRSALWLNYSALGAVIVDQSESDSYLQTEQNPRYNAVEVAQVLAKLYGASLAKASAAPPLEAWSAATNKLERWQELISKPVPTQVINIQKGKSKDGNLLSPEARNLISLILEKGGRVLLYLNKKGDAAGSVCHDCGYSPVCVKCQRRLALVSKKSILACFHCGNEQPLPVPCPKCQGTQINYYGGGIQKLADEVKKTWPKAKSVLIDGPFKKIYFDSIQEAQIILGSRTAARAVVNKQIDLMVLVSIDGELVLPEFRATERVWQLIRCLTAQSKQVLIQTQIPKNNLWDLIVNCKTEDFYKSEYLFRQQYSYPPTINLTRLTFASPKEETAKNVALQLKNILQSIIPKNVNLIGPYPDYYRMKGNNWLYHLLIKHNKDYDPKVIWPYLTDKVIVERNPWLIFS